MVGRIKISFHNFYSTNQSSSGRRSISMLPRGERSQLKIKYLLLRRDRRIQYSYIDAQNPFPICCIFYKQLFLDYILYLQIQKFVDFLSYMRHTPS